MSDKAPLAAAKLGLVAALLLMVASALVWDIVHRGPRSAAASLPPSDRLMVVSLGGEPPKPAPRPAVGRGSDRPGSVSRRSERPAGAKPSRMAEQDHGPFRTDQDQEPRPQQRYQVREGQCLYTIAVEVYGSGDRWPEIGRENNLSDPFLLREGQILRIPR